MKDAQDILDEVLGAADPVEQELGLNKMFTPTVPRPSKDSNRKRTGCNTGYT